MYLKWIVSFSHIGTMSTFSVHCKHLGNNDRYSGNTWCITNVHIIHSHVYSKTCTILRKYMYNTQKVDSMFMKSTPLVHTMYNLYSHVHTLITLDHTHIVPSLCIYCRGNVHSHYTECTKMYWKWMVQ